MSRISTQAKFQAWIRNCNAPLCSGTVADRAALYRIVPGIGPLTAATLVAHLPDLGHWDSNALTSLVRRAKFMRTWAVICHDSEVRRLYDRLRQRGKPGNIAVAAVLRKIVLQLNAVACRGTQWVPHAG